MEYDSIDVSEFRDTNKTASLRECIICQQWYFIKVNVRFKPKVSNDYQNMIQNSMNFNFYWSDLKVLVFQWCYNCYYWRKLLKDSFWFTNQVKPVERIKNTDLSKRVE